MMEASHREPARTADTEFTKMMMGGLRLTPGTSPNNKQHACRICLLLLVLPRTLLRCVCRTSKTNRLRPSTNKLSNNCWCRAVQDLPVKSCTFIVPLQCIRLSTGSRGLARQPRQFSQRPPNTPRIPQRLKHTAPAIVQTRLVALTHEQPHNCNKHLEIYAEGVPLKWRRGRRHRDSTDQSVLEPRSTSCVRVSLHIMFPITTKRIQLTNILAEAWNRNASETCGKTRGVIAALKCITMGETESPNNSETFQNRAPRSQLQPKRMWRNPGGRTKGLNEILNEIPERNL
jgi:hypothetical protein